jgi:hypothetical protein
LFRLTPSFGASSFWPVALDKDLYTAAIASDLVIVLGLPYRKLLRSTMSMSRQEKS